MTSVQFNRATHYNKKKKNYNNKCSDILDELWIYQPLPIALQVLVDVKNAINIALYEEIKAHSEECALDWSSWMSECTETQ